MTQDTWNSLSKEDQVKWDSLDDKTKLTITTYHFNKGKEYALRDAEANKMEAKQHDMMFETDDDDDNLVIEAKNHEVTPPQVNNANTTRMLYEEEGIDFGQILQAQKANTRLFTGVHEFESEEESDEDEEHTGLEVNSHWFKGFDGDEQEGEGSEEYLNELADMISAFGGTTQTNATSNASRTINAGNRNATTVHDAANTALVDAPIQEEKTIENEQGDDNEEEEYYELAADLFPDLFSGTTTGNATPEQTASPTSSPGPTQVAASKNASPTATSPTRPNNSSSPTQVATPTISGSPMATTPSRPNPSQLLTPVVSTKPGNAAAENTAKQPSPKPSPMQAVTPVISTRIINADAENTNNTLAVQQSSKQASPTQETRMVLFSKPENTGANTSESSGTTESGKGAMTRQRAMIKGKELKAVNEAEDPEAKAKSLRAQARQKKEEERKAPIDAIEQDKNKAEKNNSPQPKPSSVDPQVRSPVVTFKTDTSVTTPMQSPSTKMSSSTPSDITRSDSSKQKAQTLNDPQEDSKDISELLLIKTPEDLEDVNNLLDNFLGKANKSRKKEPTKPKEQSMEEHISSVE